MPRVTPADRDRAHRRVRNITLATAGAAGLFTVAGAAAAAGTFGGRTVTTADPSAPATQGPETDVNGNTIQPPNQPPGDGSNVGSGTSDGGGVVPSGITSGGS